MFYLMEDEKFIKVVEEHPKLYPVILGMKKEKIFREQQYEQKEKLIRKNVGLNFSREIKFSKGDYYVDVWKAFMMYSFMMY